MTLLKMEPKEPPTLTHEHTLHMYSNDLTNTDQCVWCVSLIVLMSVTRLFTAESNLSLVVGKRVASIMHTLFVEVIKLKSERFSRNSSL